MNDDSSAEMQAICARVLADALQHEQRRLARLMLETTGEVAQDLMLRACMCQEMRREVETQFAQARARN